MVSKLEAISRNLDTGNISIVDIQKIKISQTEIEHLWAAADEKGEGSKPKSGHATVSNALKLRIQECTVFEKQKDFLLRLCQIIPTTVKGMPIVCAICTHYVFLCQVLAKLWKNFRKIITPS